MVKYCPKCAKESYPLESLDGFCLEHGLEKNFSSLPKKLKLVVCNSCKKVRVFSQEQRKVIWIERESKEFYDFLWQKLKIFKELKPQEIYLKNNVLHFKIDNIPFFIQLRIIFLHFLCNNCKKNSSRAFKSIIQLRGSDKKVQEFKKFLFKKFLVYEIFLIKEEKLKEGENLFVSEKENLIKLFSDNKIKFLRTTKLVGQRKDGKKIYLDTFLVRF